ncbi:HAD-IB family phosphatase [Hyphomicrobium sp. xq]|uniref:phosphoserine phosphatase n=1 Tax=Hyphomicrobium album TaxID=2665159 RepID=A0A6I3KJ15_9HYPH|nr:HAD-IB family phosphatase [Hyphomicrobium album]MTD94399.1 HAD-IB family phosphatase [Hyphomicrobium album]
MVERPKFDAVCFDCDSTLTRIEGIDELARRSGREAEIAPLTTAAMDGALSLEEVYARRLEIVRPGRDDLAWLGERYIEELVDGTRATIAALQRLGKTVYVISGGFLQPVARLAQAVDIPASHVRAVEIQFDSTGNFSGFDAGSPLIRGDGKAEICRDLVQRHGAIAMVGDGITDLAARAGGAYVIGFGGVVRRQAMVEGADSFIADANLLCTLDVLLTGAESAQWRGSQQGRERG